MSLGIKSIWRARARCSPVAGPLMISRVPKPSSLPSLYQTTLRLESTSMPRPTPMLTPIPLDFSSPPHALLKLPSSQELSLQPRNVLNEPLNVLPRPVAETPPENKNRLFRNAFKIKADLVDEADKKIHQPVTGQPRTYPNALATKESLDEQRRDMRRQVGHRIVWDHFNRKAPDWKTCFDLMRRMTPKWSERAEMSAVRIVLPKSWTIDVNNLNLEYVDSATGVLQKLRASVDKNPSAIVLRGKSTVLAKAVDDIVRFCKEAEVYELGTVATSDYRTKQLWPTIEDAPNGGASLPEDHGGSMWVHKEYQPYEITEPYESIPRPEAWTQDNFEPYIATLCYGRIPAHLAIKFYGERRVNGRHIDTDGIRIRLIVEAFEEPSARAFVTAPILKMAVSMMAFKGGHRAEANRLIELGEELGIPMDTDTYNLMLEGYVHKRDLGFFHGFLRKMELRYFHPNIRTWLLFLQLIRGDGERRQIIVTMYELGMLNHAATRRGIADVMAPLDAYDAFKAGKSLEDFLTFQQDRYGRNWLTAGAVQGIIVELLRFHRPEDPRIDDCKRLIEIQIENGHPIETHTINIFLKHASLTKDWNTALWAISHFQSASCEPNQHTYIFLMNLAVNSRSPHALGTIYFYGVLHRKLKKASRQMLAQVLLRLHRDNFWHRWECQPTIFPKDVIATLESNKIATPRNVMSTIERVILDKWEGYIPIKPLSRSLELAYRTNDHLLHRQERNPRYNEDGVRQPMRVQDLVIKLRRVDGEPGNINVRLKGTFNPKSMIKDWDSRDVPLAEEQLMAEEGSIS